MVESKADILSKLYREQGNKEFIEGCSSCPLELYNKAISYAESKECLSLAYANRSAFYLRFKKFDECLQNIQWARENNYPEDKIQKLNEREEKCKEQKEAHAGNPVEDPWNFLKLSHPPNPKIPFIVDCLEMKENEKYGRGIYATRDIAAGDILSIEDSFISYPSYKDKNVYKYCVNCIKVCNMNLIPCLKTASFMFCSVDCREAFYKKVQNVQQPSNKINQAKVYAEIEKKFGSREKLIKFLKTVPDIKKMNYSVFDFDWSNPNDPQYGINQIKCVLTFGNKLFKVQLAHPDAGSLTKASKGNKLIDECLVHACAITGLYSRLSHHGGILGVAFAFHINHSCDSNVQRVQFGNKILIYATKPIKAGEQLFESFFLNYEENDENKDLVCHFLDLPTRARTHITSKFMGFECECDACEKNLSLINGQSFEKETVEKYGKNTYEACDAIFEYHCTLSFEPAIEQWKLNNDFITKHHGNPLSMDVHKVKKLNLLIMRKIANATLYPFNTN